MADTQRYSFEQGKLADWVKVFSRTSSVPLDRSQLFDSYADALAYAQGDGSDYRGIGKTAWVGQPISVVENNVAKFYIIGEKTTVVDGETVVERVLESVGSGVIILENFSTQDGVIVEATADKVGSLVYLTTGSSAYPKGLYVITGPGNVSAIATPDNLSIVKKDTANSGASTTYELQLNGIKLGVAIDIPKDLVVSSGSIVTFKTAPFPDGVTTAGTYIKLTLANSGGDLYINVNSLVDVYTSGDNYINVNNYKISLNWDTFVADLLADESFNENITNLLSELETTIGDLLETDYVSKQLGSRIPLYNVAIELDNDIVEYKGYFEDVDLTFKVKIPSEFENHSVSSVSIHNYEGRSVTATPVSENEFKINLQDLNQFSPDFTSDKLELTFRVVLQTGIADFSEVYINKFVTLYDFREVYVGQCSEQQYTNKVFSGPNLSKFGYVPEPKLDHFKSDVQITQTNDTVYIEESYDGAGTIVIPQYLIFALRLRTTDDELFKSIRVKSNGFTIPFEPAGTLVTSGSEGFPNNTELSGSAYRVFRSSSFILEDQTIENLEVEFCTN